MDSQDIDPLGPSPSVPFVPFMADQEELAYQFANMLDEIERSTPYKKMLADTAGLDIPDMDVGTDTTADTDGDGNDENSSESDSDKTVMPDILERGYGVMSPERPNHGLRAPPPKFGPLTTQSSMLQALPPKFGLLIASSSMPILGLQHGQSDLRAPKLDVENQMPESPLQSKSKLYSPDVGYNYGDLSPSKMDPFNSPTRVKRMQRDTQLRSASSASFLPSQVSAGQPTKQVSADASGLTSSSTPTSEQKKFTSAYGQHEADMLTPRHYPGIKMSSYDWPNSIPHVGNYIDDPFIDEDSPLLPKNRNKTTSSYTTPQPKPKPQLQPKSNVQTGPRSTSQPLPQPSTSEQTPKAKSHINTNPTGPKPTVPTRTNTAPTIRQILQTPENYTFLQLRQAARTHWITTNKALISATLRTHELAYALFTRMPTDSHYETWQAARRDVMHAVDINRLSAARRELFFPRGMKPIHTTDIGAFARMPGASLHEGVHMGGFQCAGMGIHAPGRKGGVLLGGEMALMERVCAEAMNRRKGDYQFHSAGGAGVENLNEKEKKAVRRFFVGEIVKGAERREKMKQGQEEQMVKLVAPDGKTVMVRVGEGPVSVMEG